MHIPESESVCSCEGEELGGHVYQEHPWDYLLAPVSCQEAHKLLVPACSLGFQKHPGLTCGWSLHHIGRTCFTLAPRDTRE